MQTLTYLKWVNILLLLQGYITHLPPNTIWPSWFCPYLVLQQRRIRIEAPANAAHACSYTYRPLGGDREPNVKMCFAVLFRGEIYFPTCFPSNPASCYRIGQQFLLNDLTIIGSSDAQNLRQTFSEKRTIFTFH